MFEPIIKNGSVKRSAIDKLFGLNQTDTIADCEFSDMENMCCAYPFISTRKRRRIIDTVSGSVCNIVKLEKDGENYLFTGIASEMGHKMLFYQNNAVAYKTLVNYNLVARSVVVMGSKIVIFPDKVYFDLSNPSLGLMDMGKNKVLAGATFYSSTNSSEVITNYIQGLSIGDWSDFQKGDSVIISGCSNTKNNTVCIDNFNSAVASDDIVSCVVEKIDGLKLYLLCYNKLGVLVPLKSVVSNANITKAIPDMDYVCVHNNRLWGTGNDGKFIYASALGNPLDFNSFQGLSTDSWWCEVGTDGDFVGIVSYQNHIYCFKKDSIHEVYGDKPSNFKMPYVTKVGCIDGASIVEINSILYFAGREGVYAYNGGQPSIISKKLDYCAVTASGGTDGENLYITLDDTLYVYSCEYGMWHKQDDLSIFDVATVDNELFFASERGLFKIGEGEEYIKFSLLSKKFRSSFYNVGIVNVWVKMSLAPNARVSVYTSIDDGEFTLCDTIYGEKQLFRVGVRFRKGNTFQIKLEGSGDTKIFGIDFESNIGGKNLTKLI